ncbi:MAG: hypothetical protein ACLRUZ_12480 [Faecalimonas sp.]
MIELYNTLIKEKGRVCTVWKRGKVRMYVCGPTVYNFIHIGNAQTDDRVRHSDDDILNIKDMM